MARKHDSERNLIEVLLHPPHVSQRCGAKARSTGQPCKRWAAIGSHRCKFHGGAKGSGRPKVHGRRSAEHERQASVVSALLSMFRQRYRKPRPVDLAEYSDSETVLLHDADAYDSSTVLPGPDRVEVEGISRRETGRKT
jgi:glucans biosynthesis protein